MVREIGTRVLQAMVATSPNNGTYMGHIKPEKWEFVVLDDAAVNACALPGGKVVVNTGAESRCCCLPSVEFDSKYHFLLLVSSR